MLDQASLTVYSDLSSKQSWRKFPNGMGFPFWKPLLFVFFWSLEASTCTPLGCCVDTTAMLCGHHWNVVWTPLRCCVDITEMLCGHGQGEQPQLPSANGQIGQRKSSVLHMKEPRQRDIKQFTAYIRTPDWKSLYFFLIYI